jgi:regulator of sigma E protease
MHEFLISAIAFIVLIAVMVVVHEFGHFIVAKLCGVRVEAFSFGFGPRLFGVKYGETDYKVCVFPLGGYVKMTGEAPEQNLEAPGSDTEPVKYDPGAFTSHPRWQRILIGFAGPVANLVLVMVLMMFYYSFINEVPSATVNTTTMDWIQPGSAAAAAGLETGDTILSFDGVSHPDWDAVYEQFKLNANQMVPVTVERAGKTAQLSLLVPASAKNDNFDLSEAGISPQILPGAIGVQQVQPGTPAEEAGLRSGDQIESVDGMDFHFVGTLLAYMQWEMGKPMKLEVLRNGATIEMVATPAKRDPSGWKLGFLPTSPPYREAPMPFVAAWGKSAGFFHNNSLLVGEVLQRLFSHRLSVSQLMGPVGIARAAGEVTEMRGWLPKFSLAAQISLQLGILNLLPFPILDGGMILFLIIESVMRHDINHAIKERIYTAAFVIIVAFFVFTVFNDVSKLPLFTHVKP